MRTSKKANPKNKEVHKQFKSLQELYKLKSPEQIKIRMLWDKLLIIYALLAKEQANNEVLKIHDKNFKTCEQQEIVTNDYLVNSTRLS